DHPDLQLVHAQVLQDVLTRLNRTYQACFPHFKPAPPSNGFTATGCVHEASLNNGYLFCSTMGRLTVRWSRLLHGMAKTVSCTWEAEGGYVSCSCVAVHTQPLPAISQETSIDVGLSISLGTAEGVTVANTCHHRKSQQQLATALQRLARRQRRDFHHK